MDTIPVQNNPLLHPDDVLLRIFSNKPIICQLVQLLGHIKTALAASADQKKQIDLTVHVNNKSGSQLGIMIGKDVIPEVHGSTSHYIGDGVGL